jgi:cellobiose transport system substrate-binding protein
VVGLEEGLLLTYIKNHDGFLNLFDQGGKELEKDFVDWKWQRGLADDGKFLLGLGTDVGGMALCYRKDLFQAAGLPTDRDEVTKLIPDWNAYMSVGKQFASKSTKAKWLDSGTSIMQPYIMQNGESWNFDKDDNFIGDTNPVVKQAWDMGLQMAKDGLTAKLTRWDANWDAAFKNAAFATAFCPAWYAGGVIPPRAGDAAAGKWDVAKMPGGVGNWGGSYLAVPKQTKHPKEAYVVAKYLTSKEGELAAYKEATTMPSNVAALDDPAFADSTSAYLSNAPIGKIFSESVKGVKPMVLGSKHQAVWETIQEPNMQAAEQGKLTSDAAWQKWVTEAKKLVSG